MTMKAKGCSQCQGFPIFFRRYSGEFLCKPCFISSIERRVEKTISKYDMFEPDDRIAIALSGGKDSVTLLHILEKVERSFPRSELIAITVDEGIRGYRSEAIKIASESCSELNIEHKVLSFRKLYSYTLDEMAKVAKERSRLSPCSICGVLRRKALNILAREVKATKIATAHNLDDVTQTIIINILHGGVQRITQTGSVETQTSPHFIKRVMPLCKIPEEEISLYAYLRGFRFQTSPCIYMRESLRNDVRNILNRLEVKRPGIKFTILSSVERIKPLLRGPVVERLKRCKICDEPSSEDLCRACKILSILGLQK